MTPCALLPLRSPASSLRAPPLPRCALRRAPSQAQFKVIGADGKVTYSDREPNTSEGRVVPLGARASAHAGRRRRLAVRAAPGRASIRSRSTSRRRLRALQRRARAPQAARRSFSERTGRHRRRQRGAEAPDRRARRSVADDRLADAARPVASDTWNSYLDAAGYPRDSRLPSTYQYRPATPLVEREQRAADGAARGAGAAAPRRRPRRCPRRPAASGSERAQRRALPGSGRAPTWRAARLPLRPRRPSSRTAPTRRASRRPGRTRAASRRSRS